MDKKRKSNGIVSKFKKLSTCSTKTNRGLTCFPKLFKNTRFREECGDYCAKHRKKVLMNICRMLVNGVSLVDDNGHGEDFDFQAIYVDGKITSKEFKLAEQYDNVSWEKIDELMSCMEYGGRMLFQFSGGNQRFPVKNRKFIAYWDKLEVELDPVNFIYEFPCWYLEFHVDSPPIEEVD